MDADLESFGLENVDILDLFGLQGNLEPVPGCDGPSLAPLDDASSSDAPSLFRLLTDRWAHVVGTYARQDDVANHGLANNARAYLKKDAASRWPRLLQRSSRKAVPSWSCCVSLVEESTTQNGSAPASTNQEKDEETGDSCPPALSEEDDAQSITAPLIVGRKKSENPVQPWTVACDYCHSSPFFTLRAFITHARQCSKTPSSARAKTIDVVANKCVYNCGFSSKNYTVHERRPHFVHSCGQVTTKNNQGDAGHKDCLRIPISGVNYFSAPPDSFNADHYLEAAVESLPKCVADSIAALADRELASSIRRALERCHGSKGASAETCPEIDDPARDDGSGPVLEVQDAPAHSALQRSRSSVEASSSDHKPEVAVPMPKDSCQAESHSIAAEGEPQIIEQRRRPSSIIVISSSPCPSVDVDLGSPSHITTPARFPEDGSNHLMIDSTDVADTEIALSKTGSTSDAFAGSKETSDGSTKQPDAYAFSEDCWSSIAGLPFSQAALSELSDVDFSWRDSSITVATPNSNSPASRAMAVASPAVPFSNSAKKRKRGNETPMTQDELPRRQLYFDGGLPHARTSISSISEPEAVVVTIFPSSDQQIPRYINHVPGPGLEHVVDMCSSSLPNTAGDSDNVMEAIVTGYTCDLEQASVDIPVMSSFYAPEVCSLAELQRYPEATSNDTISTDTSARLMAASIPETSQQWGQPGPQFQLTMARIVPDTAEVISLAINGDIDGLKNLFSRGLASPWDVSASRGYTLIRWALYGGMDKYETVEFLIDQGAQVDDESYDHVFDFAFRGKCSNQALQKLSRVRNSRQSNWIEEQRFPLIHKMILRLDSRPLATELEENPGAIFLKDARGRTALDWATARGQLDLMRLLLDHGSDPNTMDSQGRTTILHAVDSHDDDAVRTILNAGADPNPVLAEGRLRSSPLASATFGGLVESMTLLLRANAQVNVCNPEGRTPLHWAAITMNAEAAAVLLDSGADMNCESSDGCTPLMAATKHNSHAVLQLFINRGAAIINRTEGTQLLPIIAQYADVKTMSILASSLPLMSCLGEGAGSFGASFDTLRGRLDYNQGLDGAFSHLLLPTTRFSSV